MKSSSPSTPNPMSPGMRGTAHMVRWQPEIHALRTSGDVAIQPVWLGVRDQGLGAVGVRVEGLVPDLL